MSAHVVKLGSPEHQAVQELLAWFVMDTLDNDDRSLVEDHLRSCVACQREVLWHRQLRSAHDDALPVLDVEQAFGALRARIDQSEKSTKPGMSKPAVMKSYRQAWQRQFTWTRLAIAAQFALIAILGGELVQRPDTAPAFHALSRPVAAIGASRLVVVFSPQAPEQEMRRVLRESGARIVEGPTATDAYILEVASDHVDQALHVLRSAPVIALVQALEAKGSQ